MSLQGQAVASGAGLGGSLHPYHPYRACKKCRLHVDLQSRSATCRLVWAVLKVLLPHLFNVCCLVSATGSCVIHATTQTNQTGNVKQQNERKPHCEAPPDVCLTSMQGSSALVIGPGRVGTAISRMYSPRAPLISRTSTSVQWVEVGSPWSSLLWLAVLQSSCNHDRVPLSSADWLCRTSRFGSARRMTAWRAWSEEFPSSTTKTLSSSKMVCCVHG